MLFPILWSLALSFCRWDIVSPDINFVGLRNYQRMFTDEFFWKSLQVTFLYALGSVPLGLAVSLALALLLNRPGALTRVFRTIFYLPAIVSGVSVALLWVGLLNPEFGLINQVLTPFYRLLGIPLTSLPRWIYSERLALLSIILMSLWSVGPGAIIFLAGLQSVPQTLYEAARVDGANAFRRFLCITVPMLTPVILFNLVMGIIGSLQVFSQGYVMTGGGPRQATLFLVLYLWQRAFQDFQVGYASAMAWVLFTIILLVTLGVLGSSRRWVYYGSES